MSTARKLLSSSVMRTATMVLQILVAFVMTPLIVHAFGDRMYGFWALIGTFMGYYGLLDLGVHTAVTRFVSRALGQEDADEVNRVVSTCFVFFCGMGLAALILSLVAASAVPLFVPDATERRIVRTVLVLWGLQMTFSFPARAFYGVLTAHLRQDLYCVASIARLVAGNVAIYYALQAGHGLVAVALINLVASLAEYALITVFASMTARPRPQLALRYANRQTFHSVFGYSWKTLLVQVANVLRSKLNSFIVALFLGVNQVTYYAIGARLAEYFLDLVNNIIGNLSPVFSRYEGADRPDLLRSRILFFTRLSTVVSVFIGGSIMFYGKAFIVRWMGSSFQSSYVVVLVLCVPYTLLLTQGPASSLLYGVSKHGRLAMVTLCEGVMNVTAGALLARWGIAGVALGIGVGTSLSALVGLPLLVCRVTSVRLSEYYLQAMFVPAMKTAVLLGLYFVAVNTAVRASYLAIAWLSVVQVLLFVPVAFYLILSVQDRQLISNSLPRCLPISRSDTPLGS